MTRKQTLKLFLFFLILSASNGAFASNCRFPSPANVILKSARELHQFWIAHDSDVFSSQLMPDSSQLLRYLSGVRNHVRVLNPYVLLTKEYDDLMSSGDPELRAEAVNLNLARHHQAGEIRSMNCLEALLLNQQIERGLTWDRPMEFSAFVLKGGRNGGSALKIYYSTNDLPGGKLNVEVMNLIERDLSNGWILSSHLHNHNFNMPASKNVTLVGAPSPGLTDVALYRELSSGMGLRSASVTNGFDTLQLKNSDFFLFQTRK